jgi:hypothetical protein
MPLKLAPEHDVIHSILSQNLTLALPELDNLQSKLGNKWCRFDIEKDLDCFRAGKCARTSQVVCTNKAHPCTFRVRINI